jgi:hypothetical protein
MTTIDPWEKATECERCLQAVDDPQRRAIFANLRDLWIALGNEKSQVVTELAKEIDTIARLQRDLTGGETSTLHKSYRLRKPRPLASTPRYLNAFSI